MVFTLVLGREVEMNTKKSWTVSINILIWACPLIAAFWFYNSLNYRISIGWTPKKGDFQFLLFKLPIALLLYAPIWNFIYRLKDELNAEALLHLHSLGLVLLSLTVGAWMEFLYDVSKSEESDITFGIIIMSGLTLITATFIFAPIVFLLELRKRTIKKILTQQSI